MRYIKKPKERLNSCKDRVANETRPSEPSGIYSKKDNFAKSRGFLATISSDPELTVTPDFLPGAMTSHAVNASCCFQSVPYTALLKDASAKLGGPLASIVAKSIFEAPCIRKQCTTFDLVLKRLAIIRTSPAMAPDPVLIEKDLIGTIAGCVFPFQQLSGGCQERHDIYRHR